MKTENKISVNGTLWTITDFKRKNGPTIRIKVGFKLACTVSNQWTHYINYIYLKVHGGRTFRMEPSDVNPLDYINEQELYEAYYNHWENLNPYRMFAKSCINGYHENFSVVGKVPDLNKVKVR